jgi:DNA-binding transcriptional MerR regulator
MLWRLLFRYSVVMPNEANSPVVTLLEAGMAAERLGVSASGLRRLAIIYETVYEALPRKPRSNNRMFSEEAVERLQAARALLQAEKYRTINEALEAIKHGLVTEDEIEVLQPAKELPPQALEVLIAEIQGLREDLKVAREDNAALQSQLLATVKQLPSAEGLQEESAIVKAAKRLDRLLKRFFRP